MTVGEAKYAYWRTMLEIASASGMEKEEWCRRNCVSIKTFQHYEKMSNAAGRTCTNRHIANENTEPTGDEKGYFADRMQEKRQKRSSSRKQHFMKYR